MQQNLSLLKTQALKNRSLPLLLRAEKIRALEKQIISHQNEIALALKKDFNKPEEESYLTEIYPTLKEIQHTLTHLKEWAAPTEVNHPLALTGSRSQILLEPKGAVLIIGPWNYPFQLIAIPLVTAIAAGNTVALKPSEFTPETNKVLKKIIGQVFTSEEVQFYEGDAQTTQELLKFPFDHIFFTGSTAVGKIVMRAAAENLASVTLELGGKSPCVVDKSASVKVAAEKIAWGKFINAGQTCIAPDYIYVHKNIAEEFTVRLKKSITKFYGKELHKQLAQMISPRHFDRGMKLLELSRTYGDEILTGGNPWGEHKGITPTVVKLKDMDSPLMQEELFLPIAPIITFTDLEEVIHYINSKEKPLAAYLFAHDKKAVDQFLTQTSSGGTVINDCLLHLMNPNLPFGGVNASGIGKYHGEHGFREFSHEKAVLRQSIIGQGINILYPPYTEWKMKLIKLMTRFKI